MNDLIDIFRDEVEVNLKEATRLALALEQGAPSREQTEALMRGFHTLKGAARAIGFDAEKQIAHYLENAYHDLLDGKAEYRADLVDLSLAAIDELRACLQARLDGQEPPPPDAFEAQVERYRNGEALMTAAAPSEADAPLHQSPPAPPPSAASTPAPAFEMPDGIDLMAIFRAQAEGHIAQARSLLTGFDPGAATADEQEDLRRAFHTLKGAARAIGLDHIRDVAGSIEGLFHALKDGELAPTPDIPNAASCSLDWVEAMLNASIAGEDAPPVDCFLATIEALMNGEPFTACPAPDGTAAATAPEQEPAAEPESVAEQPSPAAAAPAPSPTTAAGPAGIAEARPRPAGGTRYRANVEYEQLDRLHRISGELTVAVASLTGQRNRLRGLKRDINRVLHHLRRDGSEQVLAESTRVLLERLSNVSTNLDDLGTAQDRSEGRLKRLVDGLADEVTQARLVPLSTLFDDYPRMVRDLARELGRQVEVLIDGDDNRIDGAVLEQLRTPLLHLVRNALDHGIEPPELRETLGKARLGRLAIEARQLGSMMRIRVIDDGTGIDLHRLRETVLANGLTSPELWDAMGLEERMQFLFLPALSTSAEVSETSGRGFGLDIVKTHIEAAGGHIGVHSEAGGGTCFEIQVPLSLSLTRCLLVSGGQHALFGRQRYAFPMNDVAAVRRVERDQLREVDGRLAAHVDEETLFLHDLHEILGLTPIKTAIEERHLLVLGDDDGSYGLLVEEVEDELDMVSRPLDERLGKVEAVSGLSVLDDGALALIVDVPDLLARMHEGSGWLHEVSAGAIAARVAEEEQEVRILVVEDSVTVREVERHFLEQAGYSVTTAVNGVDGLNKAKGGEHELMITDIDMPRMNGIELISNLRALERFRELPIVVVSYKDRLEDRERALAAGADRYVTKSEFDTDAMLGIVAEMIAGAAHNARTPA